MSDITRTETGETVREYYVNEISLKVFDLRVRGVWPFNQTATRTEMQCPDIWAGQRCQEEVGHDGMHISSRVYEIEPRWDDIMNLPRESMRGEK